MSGGPESAARKSGGMDAEITREQKRELIHRMRVPIVTFVALLLMLGINALAGWFLIFPHVWILNLGVLVVMVSTVLLFSMEVIHDPPLIRFFSALGFCWVGILFAMVLIDYTTR